MAWRVGACVSAAVRGRCVTRGILPRVASVVRPVAGPRGVAAGAASPRLLAMTPVQAGAWGAIDGMARPRMAGIARRRTRCGTVPCVAARRSCALCLDVGPVSPVSGPARTIGRRRRVRPLDCVAAWPAAGRVAPMTRPGGATGAALRMACMSRHRAAAGITPAGGGRGSVVTRSLPAGVVASVGRGGCLFLGRRRFGLAMFPPSAGLLPRSGIVPGMRGAAFFGRSAIGGGTRRRPGERQERGRAENRDG